MSSFNEHIESSIVVIFNLVILCHIFLLGLYVVLVGGQSGSLMLEIADLVSTFGGRASITRTCVTVPGPSCI